MNDVVIVSGEQRRDSAIHIYIPILPQTPLPSSLPRDAEQSSLRLQQGLVSHFKHSRVCMSIPDSIFFATGNCEFV